MLKCPKPTCDGQMRVYASRSVEHTRLIRRYRICDVCGLKRGTWEVEDAPDTPAAVRVLVRQALDVSIRSA